MSTLSGKKLNRLLLTTPKGIVLLSSWLKNQGYSSELVKRYRKYGWLESIGFGANIRAGDNVDYLGALYTLQNQGRSSIHVGARSSFSMLGKSHYLELDTKKLILFAANQDSRLPSWFKKYDWNINVELHTSDFLSPEIGLMNARVKEFTVKVSGEIRALMECLLLVPHKQELAECYEFMESMNNVHPKKVQELLEHCSSIKVKRLFLCLAEKLNHAWFSYLDLSKIDLGTGKRSIMQDGILDQKYLITIPKSWSKND